MQTDIWTHCASVGFFGFLSIFPVMAVFVLIYGLAFPASQMEAQVSTLRPFVPSIAYTLLDARLKDLADNPASHLTVGLIFSTLVALYTGSRGIKYLIVLLNLSYHTSSSRSFLRRTLLAISLTFAAILVLITALSVLAAIPLLVAYLPFPHLFERIALFARWPFLAAVIYCSFLSLYRFAPSGDKSGQRKLAPGAVLATVLWLFLSFLFSYYVQNLSNFSATFGTLSAAVVLMLWIYYSAFVIAIGAAFNFQIECGARSRC